MRIDKDHNLKPGIYRVYWKDGGASIAAVGVGSNGENWIAPTNWIEPLTSKQACHPEHPGHWSWATVARVEFVTNSAEADTTGDDADAREGATVGNTTIIELDHDRTDEIAQNPEMFAQAVLTHLRLGNGTNLPGGRVVAFFNRGLGGAVEEAWESLKRLRRWQQEATRGD